MKKADVFWQTYLNLEKEIVEISKYIYFTDTKYEVRNGEEKTISCNTQLEVFSPHICDLLIRCCVEIEAISKELYFKIGGNKKRGDTSIKFDEDCLKLIDIKWKTHKKAVMVVSPMFSFAKEENYILKPLKEAHKSKGTYWERAYQAVKHDRYLSLSKGNVKALIHALAALYLLNLYFRNDSWTTKLKDISNADYSMGSSVFAVPAPLIDIIINENLPCNIESPYVAKFIEKDYKLIEEMRREEEISFQNYLKSQPEMKEPDYISTISNVIKSGEKNNILTHLNELAKYRLNKKILQHIPFEERKRLLLNSDEWKVMINQNTIPLVENDITENNIQQKIELIATQWGIEMYKYLRRPDYISFTLSRAICEISIQ